MIRNYTRSIHPHKTQKQQHFSVSHTRPQPTLFKSKKKSFWHAPSQKLLLNSGRKLSVHEFAIKMKQHPVQFNEFWKNIDSSLSADGKDAEVFTSTHSASTYGEMTINGFLKLYNEFEKADELHNHRRILNKKQKVFYDLGSGLGKPTVLAALFIPHLQFAKGIELSSSRHTGAVSVLQQIKQKCDLKEKVRLVNGDILSPQFHYDNADIVWISSLCFSDEIANKLATKLNNELKEGTHVFTSKALNIKNKFTQMFDVEMTWTEQSKLHHYIVSK